MSTTFETTSVQATGFAARLERTLDAVTAPVAAYFRRRAVFNQIVNELSQMDDRNLADLGISRYDIGRIARDGSNEA